MDDISPRLSAAQKRVMHWLSRGWEAQPGCGSTVNVNGKKIATVATMKALHRAGFVAPDNLACWRATPTGLALRDRIPSEK